jgi:hypothetical protein
MSMVMGWLARNRHRAIDEVANAALERISAVAAAGPGVDLDRAREVPAP